MKTLLQKLCTALALLPCLASTAQVNLDFEAVPIGAYAASNSINGWTITSQSPTSCATQTAWAGGSPEFSVVSTPILNAFPSVNPFVLMPLGASPLGGTVVAQLNDQAATGLRTRIAQNFSVNASNTLFEYAFAGTWADGGHLCCEQAGIEINLYDCAGNLQANWTKSYSANGASCASGAPSFSVNNSQTWTRWQHEYIDLTNYMGSCVTIEIVSKDCVFGTHSSNIYFDAYAWGGLQAPVVCSGVGFVINSSPVSFCPGASVAQITAPAGYNSYQWYTAGANNLPVPVGSLSGGNTPTLSVTNPIAGTIYTVQMTTPSGTYMQIDTLQYSSVSAVWQGASPSCVGGASGSATVLAAGSGMGYNYAWYNASNVPVGTASTIANLLPGVYTVSVSAIGSNACGSATTAVTVGTVVPYSNIIRGYCGSAAYLSVPANGSNYQWYNSNIAIPANLGGTVASYTFNSPTPTSTVVVGYQTPQGCRDSVRFYLTPAILGSLTVSYIKPICAGGINGAATISLSPSFISPMVNSFTAQATSPAYSVVQQPSVANTFSISNLVAGTVYSITAFDGSCQYTSTLTPVIAVNNFNSVSPSTAVACPGSSVVASAIFTVPISPSQYTFTWTPNQFLLNNQANMISAMITPSTVPQGQTNVLIYTVTSTPTLANCPVSHTLAVLLTNYTTPTIVPAFAQIFCASAPPFTITPIPGGGTFTGSSASVISPFGIITPSLAPTGFNTFTYSLLPGTCVPAVTGSYAINPTPALSATGGSMLCSGVAATLTANGANTYTWNGSIVNNTLAITPTPNTPYTLAGTNTVTGCAGSITFTPTVNNLPLLPIQGNTAICIGNSATLIASGANTYSWSNNSASNGTLVLTPAVAGIYTVTGTNTLTGCSGSSTVQLMVNSLPAVGVTGNTVICNGGTATLSASGASTYSWNNNVTGAFAVVAPGTTSSYTVTGTDANGCSNIASITVSVSVCTGLEALSTTPVLNLYPNPTKGQLFFESTQPLTIYVYNSLGELLLEKAVDKGVQNISLESYSPGVYFIKAGSGNSQLVKKVIRVQ